MAPVREAGEPREQWLSTHASGTSTVGGVRRHEGTRVQGIIRELRGEKIDIVEWSEDSVLFVTNALSRQGAAGLDRRRQGTRDGGRRRGQAAVAAIGKKGQNVRLAAKLTDAHRHQE